MQQSVHLLQIWRLSAGLWAKDASNISVRTLDLSHLLAEVNVYLLVYKYTTCTQVSMVMT